MNGTPSDISAAGEISVVDRLGVARMVNAQRYYAQGEDTIETSVKWTTTISLRPIRSPL